MAGAAGAAANGHDEVEDLYLLLKDVKRMYPEVEAVTSGAILSTYQRLRVENVCTVAVLTSRSVSTSSGSARVMALRARRSLGWIAQ